MQPPFGCKSFSFCWCLCEIIFDFLSIPSSPTFLPSPAYFNRVEGLIPPNVTGLADVQQRILDYTLSIAIPPYFGDTLPVLPVVAYHDDFMEPGALPLQYVDIPLDKYIPQIFTRNTFQDQDDLPFLYAAAMGEPAPPAPPPTRAPFDDTLPLDPPEGTLEVDDSGSYATLNKRVVSMICLSSMVATLLVTKSV